MSRVSVALAVLVLGLSFPVEAQTARATGVVRDTNGRPIRGATIRAMNPEAYPREITSTSDDKGRWAMVGLRTGQWQFTVDAPGFFRVEAMAPVRVATSPPLQFTLARDPGPIPGALPQNISQQINQAAALRDKGYYDMALTAYEEIRTKYPRLTSIGLVVGDLYRMKAAQEQAVDAKLANLELAAAAYQTLLDADSEHVRARAELEATRAEVAKLR